MLSWRVMTTLTIEIDEATLARAEAKARQRGSTVGDLLRGYLNGLAREEKTPHQDAVQSLLSLSRTTRSGSGGRRWSRNEVHERGRLLTEDLQDGWKVRNLQIENPFTS